jgi:predicted CoA-binding protein
MQSQDTTTDRTNRGLATEPTSANSTLDERVRTFLAQRRIAVTGISATRQVTGNVIYRKLKAAGYQVFAVHPSASSFDGDLCYGDLSAIPGGVDGVVIVNRPEVTDAIVRQCAQAGVPRVWMHQSLMKTGTSVSPAAVSFCQAQGIAVIAGACPMMYVRGADFGHRCMRWILGLTGGLPS